MVRILLTLILTFTVTLAFTQRENCNCLVELEHTAGLIKNAKSYRYEVVKKHRTEEFSRWKDKIKSEIIADSLREYFCVGYLQKYISFFDDKHNQIYLIPGDISVAVPTYCDALDTSFVRDDRVSGIYYGGSESIIVKKVSDSAWYGIMLTSDEKAWPKGKIRLRINKTASGGFEIFEFFNNGLLFYQNNIAITGGRIHSTFWNKQNHYYFNKNHTANFTFQSVDSSFDYIGIKTLVRNTSLMKEADRFYNRYLDKLTKDNVIVDLRNNGGGSIKQAKPLLKALKRNKSIQRIYVLMNFKTASAAELTALALKKDRRTILAGEPSNGMLTYGYGNHSFSAKTVCSNFQVSLSTKRENRRYAKYEGSGITPDMDLDNGSDWIDQILKAGQRMDESR